MENNSNKRIIYPQDDGTVAIIVIAPNAQLSLEEIIKRNVPTGKPYKIVDVADVPSDRTFRAAWEYVE